jgi:alcohol dehydrogenase class IV
MLSHFVHRNAQTKVVFGPDAIAQLPAELRELGIQRPLILAGSSSARSLVYERASAALRGFDLSEFTAIPQHSSVTAVKTVMEQAHAHRADGLIAVGGGSASDTAKAAALWLAEGRELEDHASRFTPPASLSIPELKAAKLPIVAIPATASGAEVTPSLGIRTEDGRKLLFWDIQLASRLIIIDPVANVPVPVSIMLATGMNGLAHCVEGLYSKVRTPITTALALHALGLFVQALPRVAREPNSVACRAELLAAAHLSGLVLMNARTCLHHAICHALGAVTGASHGQANAVILPHAMAFNAEAARDAMISIARAWGARAGADDAVALVRGLQSEIGVPTRLPDIGVPRDSLGAVAKKVMTERGVYFNPREVHGAGEIEELLERAW